MDIGKEYAIIADGQFISGTYIGPSWFPFRHRFLCEVNHRANGVLMYENTELMTVWQWNILFRKNVQPKKS